MELIVQGKVLNMEAVQNRIGVSFVSAIFRDEIQKGLFKINRGFIGDKKSAGLMRKKAYSRDTWSSGRLWKTQVVNLIKGVILDPLTGQVVTVKRPIKAGSAGGGLFNQGLSMSLKMGIWYRTKKPIHKALEFLDTGGTITSNKYMPVPIKGQDIGKFYQKFQYWRRSKQLTVIYKNGLAFYFFNYKSGRGNLRVGEEHSGKLVAVGKKKVDIKFKLQLDQNFKQNEPLMNRHMQTAAEKAVTRINNE